jgi:hypothetical protein
MRIRFQILFTFLLIVCGASVTAQNSSAGFSAAERQTIQQYFAPAPAPELPPGMVFNNASLKKKKQLEKNHCHRALRRNCRRTEPCLLDSRKMPCRQTLKRNCPPSRPVMNVRCWMI